MEGNNVKSFENLCKIFEMRIKLDKEKKLKTPKEVLENYEKYARKIDNIYNEEFQNELRSLISPAHDIETEKTRLEKLISIVTKRLDKRTNLEQRFYDTTGENIKSLQTIVSDKELEEKKERLANITRYIDNNNEIKSIEENIDELNYSLSEEEKKREEYKSKNKIMEEELYSEFIKVKNEDNLYENINEENIDDEIANIIPLAKEYKETLEVTKDSINSLINNGINDDYSSYVEEANKSYYNVKNKELFLRIYKLVLETKEDFNAIFAKREALNTLIEERMNLIKELNITDLNILSKFEDLVVEQLKTINNEKEVLDNISNYNNRIEFKKARLEELKEENEDNEILSILKEFGLVEIYDNEEFVESEIKEKLPENKIEVEEINPYRIKEVAEAPKTLNIGLARLKGETIRERVNRKLNPPVEKAVKIPIENPTEVSNQPVEEIKSVENEVPLWNVKPNEEITNNSVNSIPVWDINSKENLQVNNVDEVNSVIPSDNNMMVTPEIDSTPMWEVPSADSNNPSNIMTHNSEELPSDNMSTTFWTPLSDEKLENGTMPNIDLINNQMNESVGGAND